MANMTREMLDARRANAKKAAAGQGKQIYDILGLSSLNCTVAMIFP